VFGVSDDARQIPARAGERIVDLVFAGELPGRRRRLATGAALAATLYAGVFFVLGRLTDSGASFGAELAARIHDAVAAARAVDVTPSPPPRPEPPAAAHVADAVGRVHPHASARPAPARAGRIAAASESPVDFTGSAFVVGSGSSYAGGTTTRSGTSRTPPANAVASGGTGDGSPHGRAHAVSLDQAAWTCPWPGEADARQVDQETVVLRVAVRADGHADRVDVVEDPGFGFGRAARQCALATRFEPARDLAGAPIAALSPPIRVHFFR
jgi:periplasmic protein TonB